MRIRNANFVVFQINLWVVLLVLRIRGIKSETRAICKGEAVKARSKGASTVFAFTSAEEVRSATLHARPGSPEHTQLHAFVGDNVRQVEKRGAMVVRIFRAGNEPARRSLRFASQQAA